jgi:hypothetical protein
MKAMSRTRSVPLLFLPETPQRSLSAKQGRPPVSVKAQARTPAFAREGHAPSAEPA